MLQLYRDVIGLPELFRDERRGRVHLRAGDGQLILAEAEREQVLAAWPGVPPQLYEATDEAQLILGPVRHGAVHFALQVDDVQWRQVSERMADAGVVTRGPWSWGDSMQSRYFLDPDGNCGELIRSL